MEKVLEQEQRQKELRRIFDSYDDNMDGFVNLSFLIEEVELQGFKILEEKFRFQEIQEFIDKLEKKINTELDFDLFQKLMGLKDGDLLEKALLGKLILPDFFEFTESIKKIYDIVETVNYGENASYIPQLAEVDSNLFSIAACTVDGQQ